MHIRKLVLNGTLVTISQILWVALGLVTRRIFVSLLSVEYLGYENVFSNLLAMLSVADLGVESVIAVRLYEAVAKKDYKQICKLMWIFKWFYRGVAVFVTLCSILLYPILPFIITEAASSWTFLRTVYVIQVAATVAGYFLSYQRVIFIAHEQNYYCSLADLLMRALTQAMQIMVLLLWQNYLLYLAVKLSAAPLANLILAVIARKRFPFISAPTVATKQDIKDFNLVRETKNFFVHKVTALSFNATGTVIVSAFCGIYTAAMYGNYASLYLMATGILLTQPFNALKSSIGNIVNEEKDVGRQRKVFSMVSAASDIYAMQIMLGFLLFTQPVMELWLGREFLLSNRLVVLYAVEQGILTWQYGMYAYRGVLGNFAKDRTIQVLAAIANLTVAIIFVGALGETAVVMGLTAGLMLSTMGYAVVVYQEFLHQPLQGYIKERILLFCMMLLEIILVTHFVDIGAPASIARLIAYLLVWIVLGAVNCVLMCSREGARTFFLFLTKSLQAKVYIHRRR